MPPEQVADTRRRPITFDYVLINVKSLSRLIHAERAPGQAAPSPSVLHCSALEDFPALPPPCPSSAPSATCVSGHYKPQDPFQALESPRYGMGWGWYFASPRVLSIQPGFRFLQAASSLAPARSLPWKLGLASPLQSTLGLLSQCQVRPQVHLAHN